MKKALWTLNINNYRPDILGLTFPLFKKFAQKIGADFNVITEPKINWHHPGMEKFQLYTLGKDYDWNIFIDSDALIHPDMFDPTDLLHKDTTAAWEVSDFTPVRFRSDPYFLRDGRFHGKGNWFACVSDWCLDYYHLPEDITIEEAVKRVFPTHGELMALCNIDSNHLVEDYLVSRNIARFGLKHVLVCDELKKFNRNQFYCPNYVLNQQGQQEMRMGGPLWHQYTHTADNKLTLMKQQLKDWRISIDDTPPDTPVRISDELEANSFGVGLGKSEVCK